MSLFSIIAVTFHTTLDKVKVARDVLEMQNLASQYDRKCRFKN